MASVHIACTEHPDAPIIEDVGAGDQICSACGLVLGDRVIDSGAEWRHFTDDKGQTGCSRVGPTEDASTSASGLRSRDAVDRALLEGFKEISQISARLHIPTVIVDRANNIFKLVHNDKRLRRSTDALISACVYRACAESGAPRTFKEICGATSVSKAEIGRCHKLISEALSSSASTSVIPEDFIPRFCGKLGLSKPVQLAAAAIAVRASELDLASASAPAAIAAAAIYMASQASDEKRSYKEVFAISGASFRRSYKLMNERAQELFPENFKFTATPIAHLPKT